MSTALEVYRCPNGRQVLRDGLDFMDYSKPGETKTFTCPDCFLKVFIRTPQNPFAVGIMDGDLENGIENPDEKYVLVIGDCELNSS